VCKVNFRPKEAAVFVDFFGWFRDGCDVFLAMEYIPLGDLETNVKAHSGRIPEIEARDITEQILSRLEVMHAESFAHRDLKSDPLQYCRIEAYITHTALPSPVRQSA
jgi:serine/threonine protein kinase